MGEINLFVPGIPAPGGSKRPVRAGGKPDGRVLLIDDARGNRAWRDRVASEASKSYRGPLLDGPLVLVLDFTLPRPKGHYGTGRNVSAVRQGAPEFPAVKPDLTKFVRAVEDSLTGILWRDDAQVVCQHATKRYGHPAGVKVTVLRARKGVPA